MEIWRFYHCIWSIEEQIWQLYFKCILITPNDELIISQMKVLVHEKWFGGFVTRFEAEGLLHNCVEGTFLVRFSK